MGEGQPSRDESAAAAAPAVISEIQALRRLQELNSRISTAQDYPTRLGEVAAACADLLGTDTVRIRVFGAEPRRIHHGGSDGLWSVVHDDDLQWRPEDDVIIVEDLAALPEKGAVLRNVGIQATLSKALTGLNGDALGRLDLYFPRPHQPSERDLLYLDLLARRAAGLIERSYHEASAQLRNDWLSAALEAGRAGAFEWDIVRNVNHWSPELQRLYGLKPGEFQGTFEAWAELIHPEDLARTAEIVSDTLATGELAAEWRILRGDGEVRWLRGSGRVFYDEQRRPTRMYGINIDITDQKRAEEALAASEHRFRALADQVSEGIFIADSEGRFVNVNSAAGRLLGYEVDELLAMTVGDVIHPDEHCRLPAQFEALATGNVVRGDWRYVRKDGSTFIGELDGRMLPDGGYQGVTRDVTDRRRAEEELRQANRDLEQFAFSATHDLREPLRNIGIFSELLALKYRDKLDDQGRAFVETVVAGAARMDTMLQDLFAYTQTFTLSVPEEPMDAQKALDGALANLATSIAETRAAVTHDDMPMLRVHTTHLQQIFQNLIGNALKYRSAGVTPEVEIRVRREGAYWRFSVKDNGLGILPEYRDLIFGLFKRLHTSEKYPGTGMGLAICQRILSRYQGRIWVESEPGQGSTFLFELPA